MLTKELQQAPYVSELEGCVASRPDLWKERAAKGAREGGGEGEALALSPVGFPK
jgi:hypothetical protein